MSERTIRRPLVMIAVMAATVTVAIEATIVSTAMPQIAAQLGDLRLYSWVFAAFLLAQTATTIIYGKLADMYGRKPILMAGIAVFLLGSLLCGFATSMPMLIAFRLLQGVGAGAIQPVTLTIVGDLYAGHERGKVQGYLSGVWGVSAVTGPLLGGLIVEHLSWAWVFWINLPVGLLCVAVLVAFLHERVATAERHVDVAGAAFFALCVAGVMTMLTELGVSARNVWIAAAVAVVSGGGFVWQERRAADPMVAFGLWGRRSLASTNTATLLFSMALIGLSAFLPIYVQAVLNRSALVAGFTLTAMSFGWPVGAMIAAKVTFARLGLRGTFLLGSVLLPIGAAAMLLLQPGSPAALAGLGSLLMGIGMGLSSTSALVLIQGSVAWEARGAATASNVFARSLGSTFGATVLGGVLNASLTGGPIGYDGIRTLLDNPGQRLANPAMTTALGHSLHVTFAAMVLMTLLGLAAACLVPRVEIKRPATV